MKLSEAIILGSVSTTQRFDGMGSGQELCVIQTALYAIGIPPSREMYITLWEVWPWLRSVTAIHPVKGTIETVTRILYSLNDTYEWPRPRIAEWVKIIEPSEVALPVTQETTLVEAAR